MNPRSLAMQRVRSGSMLRTLRSDAAALPPLTAKPQSMWHANASMLQVLALCLPLAFGENNSAIVTQIAGQKESDLLPKSEKLILYRHPPYAGIKGVTKRSKLRRRYNSPASKIKIRPSPHHRYGDSFGYFKPPLGPSSYPGHAEEPPSVPFLDFQQLNLDAHDFRIPSSSYEAQSMDLNFYNNEQDLYGPPKYAAIDYNLDGPPSGSNGGHVPHQKYGLPTLEQSIGYNSYDTPESYISHHHHHHHRKPPHFVQPSSHYGVPAPAAPPDLGYIPSFSHGESAIRPPDLDSYSIYEQKVPNVGYHQNFAEPPKPASPPPPPVPPQHNSNVHFGHSPPGYEMSTSYQMNNQQYDQTHQYRLPQQQHEVPAPQPPPPPAPPQNPIAYTPIESHQSYPQEDYAPPSQELPLNPNPKTPSFDYTKSSYEVPIYDAIPFEASNLEEQELYPPIVNGKNPNSNKVHTDTNTLGTSKRRRKRKRGPNNAVVSKKHTLDVPELQQAYDDDTHTRGIESDTHTDTDAHGSHYVEHKRKFANYLTSTTRTTFTRTTTPSPWSPMEVRSTASTVFLPTVVTSTPSTRSVTRSSNVNRGTSRYHFTTPSDHSLIKPISTVTIEKSHSQSYYDGTIAPPTYQQFPSHNNGRGQTRTRPSYKREPAIPLALQPAGGGDDPSKRTTKGVFDTTLFKSPHNNREIQRKLNVLHQSLPKNHKLY